jgi:23S rRNA (guanine745-N1)-methyltransferase
VSLALRCTVRGCNRRLSRDGDALRCGAGHAFDRAREGYWSLLQPQDRRSRGAGDSDDAVEARRRWLARGPASGLIALLRRTIDALAIPPDGAAIDIGCGEGTITTGVLGGRGLDVAGVDLASRAVRLASRLEPAVTWIVANADRGLPFEDGSVGLAISIFGRRPAAELARVIAPGGVVVVAVPAADDLIELRAAAKGDEVFRDRVPSVVEELAQAFDLLARTSWRERVRHGREAARDALAMTYRGERASERRRLAALDAIDVTLAAEILVWKLGTATC